MGKIRYRITYFPNEQKYSIWRHRDDNTVELVKEWFNSRAEASDWLNRYYAFSNDISIDGDTYELITN